MAYACKDTELGGNPIGFQRSDESSGPLHPCRALVRTPGPRRVRRVRIQQTHAHQEVDVSEHVQVERMTQVCLYIGGAEGQGLPVANDRATCRSRSSGIEDYRLAVVDRALSTAGRRRGRPG